MKKIAAPIIVIVITLGSFLAFRLFFHAKKTEPVLPQDILPSNLLLYLESSALNNFKETLRVEKFSAGLNLLDWPQILKEENIKPLQVPPGLSAIVKVLSTPASQDFIDKQLQNQISIAVYPFALSQFDDLGAYLVASNIVVVKHTPNVADFTIDLLAFLKQFSSAWDTTMIPYKGQDIYAVAMPGSYVRICYTAIGDLVVMGFGDKAARHSIDTLHDRKSSLKTRADFQLARDIPLSKGDTFLYLNFDQIKNSIGQNIAQIVLWHYDGTPDLPDLKRFFQQLGQHFQLLESVSLTLPSSAPQLLRSTGRIFFRKSADSVKNALLARCPNLKDNTSPLIPRDVLFYLWSSCDAGYVKNFLLSSDPQKDIPASPPWPSLWDMFGRDIPAKLPDDLSSALTKETAMVITQTPAGDVSSPHSAASWVLGTGEPAKAVTLALNIAASFDGETITEEIYNGHTLFVKPAADSSFLALSALSSYVLASAAPAAAHDLSDTFAGIKESVLLNTPFLKSPNDPDTDSAALLYTPLRSFVEHVQQYLGLIQYRLNNIQQAKAREEETTRRSLEKTRQGIVSLKDALKKLGTDAMLRQGAGEDDPLGSLAALKKIDSAIQVKTNILKKYRRDLGPLESELAQLIAIKNSTTEQLTPTGLARVTVVTEEIKKIKTDIPRLEAQITDLEASKTAPADIAEQILKVSTEQEKGLRDLDAALREEREQEEKIARLQKEQARLTKLKSRYQNFVSPLLTPLGFLETVLLKFKSENDELHFILNLNFHIPGVN